MNKIKKASCGTFSSTIVDISCVNKLSLLCTECQHTKSLKKEKSDASNLTKCTPKKYTAIRILIVS